MKLAHWSEMCCLLSLAAWRAPECGPMLGLQVREKETEISRIIRSFRFAYLNLKDNSLELIREPFIRVVELNVGSVFSQ